MQLFLLNAWDILLRVLTAGAAGMAALTGGFDMGTRALGIIMLLDYVSGIALSIKGKSKKTAGGYLSSKAGWRGVGKKALIVCVILVAALLDRVAGEGSTLRMTVTWFYLSNEAISVLENVAALGLPVPEKMKRLLEIYRQRMNENE